MGKQKGHNASQRESNTVKGGAGLPVSADSPQKVKSPPAESQVGKAHSRNWAIVRDAWLSYPPKIDPGIILGAELSDFAGLLTAARNCKAALTNNTSDFRENIPGIQLEMIHHALLYLQKAANVLGCCELQNSTHPTWSISIGYQSALLGLEGVLRIFGICAIEVDNISLIVDVWPKAPDELSKKQLSFYRLGEEQRVLLCGKIDHYHNWALLQRVLRVLENAPIPKGISQSLCSIDHKKFARQRNDLHYRVNWPFSDLLQHISEPSLVNFRSASDLEDALNPMDARFSTALAFAMLTIGVLLLEDLSRISQAFAVHYDAISKTLNASQHPYFQVLFSNIKVATSS